MELEFKKPKKRFGETFRIGYYFKGEFLSRYKSKSLKMLREKVNHLSDEEKHKTDEWKIISAEYLKSCETTKKINKTKKPYWDKVNKRILQRKIVKLYEKINDVKERKQEIINEFDERINKIHIEIQKIGKVMGEKNE